MKKTTQEWVKKAEMDYALAKQGRRSKVPVDEGVCFHCQQCAEKYLKGLMEEDGLAVPKTHYLDGRLSTPPRATPSDIATLAARLALSHAFCRRHTLSGQKGQQEAGDCCTARATRVRAAAREQPCWAFANHGTKNRRLNLSLILIPRFADKINCNIQLAILTPKSFRDAFGAFLNTAGQILFDRAAGNDVPPDSVQVSHGRVELGKPANRRNDRRPCGSSACLQSRKPGTSRYRSSPQQGILNLNQIIDPGHPYALSAAVSKLKARPKRE